MRLMDYDVVCPGEADFALGLSTYRRLCKEAGMDTICANLRVAGKPVFPATAIRVVDGVRLGFVGLLSATKGLPREAGESVIIEDPVACARSAVRSLKGSADLIVALSHLGFDADRVLAREVSDIGLVIGGHSSEPLFTGGLFGTTAIYRGGRQGKTIGRVRIRFGKPGLETSFAALATANPETVAERVESETIVVKSSLPENATCAKLVTAYRRGIKEEASKPQPGPFPVVRESSSSSLYWGAARCAKCHPKQTQFWRSTGHARAYETLRMGARHLELECLPCHTTGFVQTRNRPGNRGPTDVDGLEAVQCEACHAPGGLHDRPDLRSLASRKTTCLACHDAKNSPKFDHGSWLARARCPKTK